MDPTTVIAPQWQQAIYKVLKEGGVKQIAYVPDAGHAHAIRSAQADPDMQDMLPEQGRNVPDSLYWARRLRDGDVKQGTAPVSVSTASGATTTTSPAAAATSTAGSKS